MADVLLSYLDEWQGVPFSWKTHNCGHFVSGWCERKAGRLAVGYELLGRFTCERGFWRVMRREGFAGLIDLANCMLRDFGRFKGADMARGDIVVAQQNGARSPAFGISLGELIAFTGAHALIYSRRFALHAAWSI